MAFPEISVVDTAHSQPATGRKLRVLTVVDRPRPGLAEISYAFANYVKLAGHEVEVLHSVQDPGIPAQPWSLLRLWRLAWASDVVLVWSYGRTALLLPLLVPLTGNTHWSFVLHEPGGLGAKILKGDAKLRAFISAFLEGMACRWARSIIVPRADRTNLVDDSKVVFAPLLYFVNATPPALQERQNVLYLGRRDPRRKAALFASEGFRSKVRAGVAGAGFEFFPTEPSQPGSMEQKWDAWRRASAVLNFYTVPYNQSGVTVEALQHGVPVVVSEFDPSSELLVGLGLSLPPTASDDELSQALVNAIRRQAELAPQLKELGSRLGGGQAFDAHWRPWLDAISASR